MKRVLPASLLTTLLALWLSAPASAACGARLKVDGVDLTTATVDDLRAALDSGKTTSAALVRAYLARIDDCNVELRAVIRANPAALPEARKRDAARGAARLRSPLHGIPVLIKDNIDVLGQVTTAGSLALADNRRKNDAPLIAALIESGAIVLGKANLSEWANFRSRGSSSGWSAVGGLTVNPHDRRRTACGSSSGSAVAIAAHMAPLAVGTETNGSIVCPSSINGVVGLKPTVGLVSQEGIVPISHTQDTAGPMTRSVRDAAMLLAAIQTRPGAPTNYTDGLRADSLRGVRLGVARFIKGYRGPTDRVFEAALAVLKRQGAELVDIEKFDFQDLGDLEMTILLTEFKVNLNAYLTTTPPAVTARTLEALIAFNAAEPRELVHFNQDLFESSQATRGLESAPYTWALPKALAIARDGIDKLLADNKVVALIAPTTGPAWMVDLVNGDRGVGSASMLAAVAGYPHLTVPMGEAGGLPVGLSFFGKAWDEQTLLSLGYAFEQARR
jgi:amidase